MQQAMRAEKALEAALPLAPVAKRAAAACAGGQGRRSRSRQTAWHMLLVHVVSGASLAPGTLLGSKCCEDAGTPESGDG